MYFTVWRNGVMFRDVVFVTGQTVVAALKRQPALTAEQPVAYPLRFVDGCMMSVHDGSNTRQWRSAQFGEQFVDISRNPIEVIIGIHLAKMRRPDISRLKRMQFHFVHARTATPRLEKEISVWVGLGVAQRQRPHLSGCWVRLID